MTMIAAVQPPTRVDAANRAAVLPVDRFVRNLWYVAAWSHEVGDLPFARRLLDVPVALWRDDTGRACALEDRCCHRGLPLSMGRIVDGHLQCGYHGLTYDRDGRCVRVPGQDRVPPKARVVRFPLVEQDGLLWIWLGDADRADPSRIVRVARHVDPSWSWQGEHFAYRADHLLLYDNLLDLTHVGYVHPQTIGGDAEDHSSASTTITRDGDTVQGVRWMRNVRPPAAYQALRPFAGRIDRWQTMRFSPGAVRISVAAKDAGTARDADDFDDAYESHGFHGVTPESPGRCHYFWSVGIPARFDAPGDEFKFISGTLSPASSLRLQSSIQRVAAEFDQLVRQDIRLPLERRNSCTVILAMSSWEFSEFSKLRRTPRSPSKK